MTKIHGDFGAATGVANPFLYNQFETALLSVGQLSASLLDSTGAGTGVGLHVDTAFSTEGVSGASADTGVGEFPEAVLDGYARTGNGATSVLRFSGLPSGSSYTLQLTGVTGTAGRDTQYTVEGVSKDYILGSAASPTAATSFTGTVDPDGEIIVTVEKAASGSFYGYINGFILEYTAAASGLTIDSTDATMQRNTNFQVVCSNPSTTPTTGNTTLTNGNDTLTPSSVTGSDPYTLTFPVGDLTKQVDAVGYDWTLEITPDEP
jgi:hypothetical protein